MEDTGFIYLGKSPDALTFAVPYPDSAPFEGEDLIEGGRTVGGQVVFTKINRTQEKQNMSWSNLVPKTPITPPGQMTVDDWYALNRWIRDNGKMFYCRYYSYIYGEWNTRRMYAGDPSCTPVRVRMGSNEATAIQEASLNFIDGGY